MNIDKTLLNIIIDFSDNLGFEINYDFKGLVLTHTTEKNNGPQVKSIEKRDKIPSVFFSYSWDNEEHRRWVLRLAKDLIQVGVKVIIDEWDLRDFNDDLNLFMESGIRDSNFVIIICTPKYAKKANIRKGVAYTKCCKM